MPACQVPCATLALACLAFAAPAQHLQPHAGALVDLWTHHAVWPGTITRVATARCSSLGYPDVLFLKGDRVLWSVAPGMFDWNIALPNAPAGVTAFAVLSAAAGGSGPDAILLATSAGLQRWSAAGFAVTPWGGPGWPVVDILQHVRTTAGEWVVGAANRGRLVYCGDATAAPQAWPVEGDVLDVLPIAWDASPGDEIAIATTAGLFIRSANGAVLVSRRYPQSHARLARVRFGTAEALAAAIAVPGVGWFLSAASAGWEESSPLPYGVGALSAGDCNGDGYDDLALSRTDSQCLDIVMNLGAFGLPWFPFQRATGFEVQLPTGTTPIASNAVGANLGDLDGDGDGDLFYPLHSAPGSIARGVAPMASAADVTIDYVHIGLYGEDPQSVRRAVYADVELANRPATATDVELIAWRIDGAGTDSVLVPGRLGRSVSPIAAHVASGSYGPFATGSVSIASSELQGGSVALCLRFVRQEGGAIVHAWPPRWVLVTNDQAVFDRNRAELPGAVADPGGVGGGETDGAIVIPVIPPKPPVPPAPVPPA